MKEKRELEQEIARTKEFSQKQVNINKRNKRFNNQIEYHLLQKSAENKLHNEVSDLIIEIS